MIIYTSALRLGSIACRHGGRMRDGCRFGVPKWVQMMRRRRRRRKLHKAQLPKIAVIEILCDDQGSRMQALSTALL